MKPFVDRHIGPDFHQKKAMLSAVGVGDLATLIAKTIPSSILINKELKVPSALSENDYLKHIKAIGQKNKVFRSYIGQGYHGTITPSVILRNIFENPAWYTQYTPYQAEISQGRLEALLNFQTMVADLTGLPLANASLLDEATAASEAMTMSHAIKNKRAKTPRDKFFIDNHVFTHTVEVLEGKAEPLGIEIVRGDYGSMEMDASYFGALVQYPNSQGSVEDYQSFATRLNDNDQMVVVAADIMSLTLLASPGSWGADIVIGTTQRLGIPMGMGGPHAAYFATHENFKRQLPGRIIGLSKDRHGNVALRMALQTREQHIKREKATSNICTAQALLAIMASMYACYHGPDGLEEIGKHIYGSTRKLFYFFKQQGYQVVNQFYFDTLTVACDADQMKTIKAKAADKGINFYYTTTTVSISLDETVGDSDLADIKDIFAVKNIADFTNGIVCGIKPEMERKDAYLTHPVFSTHRTETKMMRYIKSLESKDLSLVHAMIPLGSCTMKLNAASELIPVSWPEFAHIHPFAPTDQTLGYQEMINNLENYLSDITGFSGCTLQPNSGAQGEYTGLMLIKAYHKAKGESHRNIMLIPSSAHGTNPASAVIAGMKVVVVKCDDNGNISLEDLHAKIAEHNNSLSGIMITYPSTHGVFEEAVIEICDSIHKAGGLVYMDGANMNAQVGLTSPGAIHADCCHLNLHKTFAIPHGGGGPGMGPVCVNDKLKPFLPGHHHMDNSSEAILPVSAAPYGSASILLISYGYIMMLGPDGLKKSTELAILNANYLRAKLESDYSVLYTGKHGFCAHELIIDLRDYKEAGVSAEDVAKRLIDYGFHAPTLSFPVPGTIMIEPTESESLEELDRFISAMLSIRAEIREMQNGVADKEDNVLVNAPHPLSEVTADEWSHPYPRSKAAYPLDYLKDHGKFWPMVSRVDNAYGDRNLICTCPPIEEYMDM